MITNNSNRGQSNVVGVALLLGIVVVSMSVLMAGAGVLVERQSASADATRVADGLERALSSVETTGMHREKVSFSSGTLQPVDRQLRILDGSTVVRSVDVDALVFTAENHRVAFIAGAIVRGNPGNAWLYTEPPITASVGDNRGGVLIVGASRISSTDSVSGTGGVTATLRTNVTHNREYIGNGTYSVAIESATLEPFVRYFTEQGRTVGQRDIDGDGIESVVVTFETERMTYLVIHDLDMEAHSG
jgi:flagellin-like protein